MAELKKGVPVTSGVSLASLSDSPVFRVILMLGIILLLQIPILKIYMLISERRTSREAAIRNVTYTWGERQVVAGPLIAVPYRFRWVEKLEKGQEKVHTETRKAFFLPQALDFEIKTENEYRSRGIYKVPLYKAQFKAKGKFLRPSFVDLGVADDDVLWQLAEISVGLSDIRAIQDQTRMALSGRELNFLPGPGTFGFFKSGFYAPLKQMLPAEKEFEFELTLNFNGSSAVHFLPFAELTRGKIASNWPDPSFSGHWLPKEREVSASGFSAIWEIPFLGRNFPQQWLDGAQNADQVMATTFGVDFFSSVDNYSMSERSVKYEFLFLVLAFLCFFLFEVLARLRIHPIQYLLVGSAMCLFYLLEISLAEHVGFLTAYVIATIATVGLVATYSWTVLHTGIRACMIGVGLLALYIYLYALLRLEDYALLIGSLALFGILGAVMYLTRNINWYDLRGEKK